MEDTFKKYLIYIHERKLSDNMIHKYFIFVLPNIQ